MLKQIDTKMEAAITRAALRDFAEDFGGVDELARDTFEVVRAKFGYATKGGTPLNKTYEATRKPLAKVKRMIEAGANPSIDEFGDVDPDICTLAKAYLDRAEADFADRVVEAVNLIRAQGIETAERRLMARLKRSPWTSHLLEVRYAGAGGNNTPEGEATDGVNTEDAVVTDIIEEMQERVKQGSTNLSFEEHPDAFNVAALWEAAQEIYLYRKGLSMRLMQRVREGK